jgi:hypothetical protein
MIETSKGAPVILHSFLNPQSSNTSNTEGRGNAATASGVLDQTREALRPLSSSTIEEPTSAHARDTAGAGEATHVGGALIKAAVSDVMTSPQQLPNGGLDKDKGKSVEEAQSPVIAQLVDAKTEEDPQLPPLLIATVVAPTHDQEARRAAAKLDRLGVEFQRRWVREQVQSQQQGREKDDADEDRDRDGEGRADG